MPEPRTSLERSSALMATLVRRRLIALAVFAVTVALAAVTVLGSPRQYDATAQILLQPTDAVAAALTPGGVSSPANAQRDVDTYARLITVAPVVEAVRSQLGIQASNASVAAGITVDGQADSNLVSITARDTSPREAARLASTFAAAYGDYRRTTAQRTIGTAIRTGQESLRALRAAGASRAQRQAVEDRLQQLVTQSATETGGVQLVRDATVPSSPSAPNVPMRLAAAVLFGLALALGAALLLDRVDRRLLDDPALAEALGTSVLGHVDLRRRGTRREQGYADLSAQVRDALRPGEHRSVLVVGRARTGASREVAAGLAVQLAAEARSTLLLEADLRSEVEGRPRDGERPGLVQVLAGTAALSDATSTVHVVPRDLEDGAPAGVSFGWVAPGGRPRNPAALLARPELARTLNRAQESAQAVVVDGGAVTPVGDLAPLARACDGVLLVVERRRLTEPAARRIRAALEPHAAAVLGVVVLDGFGRGSAAPPLPPLASPSDDAAGDLPRPARPAPLTAVS